MSKPAKFEFLQSRVNKDVVVIMMNGYLLRGKLVRFDESGLVVFTDQYEPTRPKGAEIFIQNHAYSTVI